MARSKKTAPRKPKTSSAEPPQGETPVEDAEIVSEAVATEDETTATGDAPVIAADAVAEPEEIVPQGDDAGAKDEATADASPETGDAAEPAKTEDTETAGDTNDPGAESGSDASSAPSSEPEEPAQDPPEPEPATVIAPPTVQPQNVIVRKTGFWPVLLGGVIAAGLGFIAARALDPNGTIFGDSALRQDMTAAITEQSGRIDTALEDIAALRAAQESATPLTPEDVNAAVTEALSPVETALAGISDRVTELEARPVVEVAGTDEIAQAYEAELAALREAMDAQRAEIDAIAADATAKLEEAAAQAAAVENSAEAAARAAATRSALSRVQAALEAGGPYDAALGDLSELSGTDIPAPLADNAVEGIATLGQLQASFPDAARAALDAARRGADVEGSTMDRLTAFLETQVGARSVTPREGDDPDAVLSRAEAALRDGRLNDTLAELDILPDTAADALAGWRETAEARLAALAAAEDLAASLTAN